MRNESDMMEQKETKRELGKRKTILVAVAALLVLLAAGTVAVGLTTGWFSHNKKAVGVAKQKEQNQAASKGETLVSEAVKALDTVTLAESHEQLFAIFREQGNIYDPAQNMGDEQYDSSISDGAYVEEVTNGTASDSDGESMDTEEGMDYGEGDAFSETNIQEQGVEEGDIIKTDGTFLYLLQENENAIRVVKANDGSMQECDQYLLPEGSPREFFVQDGVVTVIMESFQSYYYDNQGIAITEGEARERETTLQQYYDSSGTLPEGENVTSLSVCNVWRATTEVLSLGVTQEGTLHALGSMTQDGNYTSSRMVDGVMYLFTNYYTQIYDSTGASVEEYVPRINGECMPAGCIAIPNNLESNAYIVCSSFEAAQPNTILQQLSVLTNDYSDNLYVSPKTIYVTSTEYYDLEEEWEQETDCSTEIIKILYDKGEMTLAGQMFVKGSILNRFSMDEQDGYLRMVTTGLIKQEDYVSSNFLFVVNEQMELVGSIENIALDETVQSVRFMGDVGYFVTYKNTDPLFSVNLSDPANPVIMDALKIPGFSSYMHVYSGDLLFGLGEETNPDTGKYLGMKLSMFSISNPYDVQELDKYLLGKNAETGEYLYSEALYNHKALLISPQRNLLGIPINEDAQWDEEAMDWQNQYSYRLFTYEENGFQEIFSFVSDCDGIRGVYIGDILYICAWESRRGETISAFDMSNGYAAVGELILEKQYTNNQETNWIE